MADFLIEISNLKGDKGEDGDITPAALAAKEAAEAAAEQASIDAGNAQVAKNDAEDAREQANASAQQAAAQAASVIGVIPAYHDGNANFPRPNTAGKVEWEGWVWPNNMLDRDRVVIVEQEIIEPEIQWLWDFDTRNLQSAEGSAVANWVNAGSHAANLVQANSVKQPVFHAESSPGKGDAYLSFDGVDDALSTGQQAATALPITYVIAFRFKSTDFSSSTVRPIIYSPLGTPSALAVQGRSGRFQIHAGSSVSVTDAAPPVSDVWYVLSVTFSGANNATLRINGTSYHVSAVGNNPNVGMVLGSIQTGSTNAHIDIGVVRAIAGPIANLPQVEAALASRFGVTLAV